MNLANIRPRHKRPSRTSCCQTGADHHRGRLSCVWKT